MTDHGYSGQIVTDYNMYQFNHYARDFWKKHKIREYTAPLELNSTELAHIEKEGLEVIIYGYLPMMVSAGCIQKTRGNCRKQSGVTTIVDRYHKSFMVKNECDYCYNVMYNYAPLYLGDKMDEVRNLGKISKRFMFTFETPDEIRKILELYKEEQPFSDGEFTRGHWKRGIK